MNAHKLPIDVTFEIGQLPDHWYHVTAVLSWKDEYSQRMDTCLVLQDELDKIKEALCFLIGETFDIHEIHERKENKEAKYAILD